MKSKKKQRILALILSMVLMLSASISALAEGDVQTEASGTETTENQAAVQSLEQETVPETEVTTEEGGIDTQSAETSTEPVQENTEQEVTETPAEPEQGVTEETAETTDTTQSQAQSTEVQEESDAVEEIPVEEQPGETTEETVTEETVVSEAAELKQEFTDENGNVTQTVTAYVPEGAFQATADQISMEVSLLNTDDTNYIKGMMEELLLENYYLDGYVLYQIDFKVNGEITQPAKAVTISMTGNDLAVEDTQKAHVFYYDPEDPEVEDDEDQLAEVIQKDQLIKSLEESGESTENIEDYDYSEIAVNEGNADTITVKGWKSTIYGCYVEKEAEPVTLEGSAEDIHVTLTGPVSSFPDEGELTLSVKEVNKKTDKLAEKAVEEQAEKEDLEVVNYTALDITILKDGEEIQPLGPVNVTFTKEEKEEKEKSKDAKPDQIKVFHVDEETGKAQDMKAAVSDSGEAKIETTHFSVYVVVNLDQLGGQINVTVEHYATGLKSLNNTGNTPQGAKDGLQSVGDGNWVPSYTVSQEETQIYTDDTITLDNGLKTSVENLSKIYLSNLNKENKNYTLTGIKVKNKNDKEWTEYQLNSKEDLKLTGDTTIRMLYTPDSSGEKVTLQTPVKFFDYDVTENETGRATLGGINNNGGDGIVTDKRGINDDSNLLDKTIPELTNSRLKFGFRSNGFFHTSADEPGNYGDFLNTTNSQNGFAVKKNIVEDSLDENGNIQYSAGITGPALFDDGSPKGKTEVSGYNLGFIQEGDTYTLSQVYKGGNSVLGNLQNIRNIQGNIYANNFWPLDQDKHIDPLFGGGEVAKWYGIAILGDGTWFANRKVINNQPRDSAIGYSDDFVAHNWYFGMEYEFTFTLGDYVGPLNFYFRGDDDFWLYVDGELKLDLGGIHSSVGQYLDLSYLKKQDSNKEHTIKIYYLERGGYGSSCYMQFTIPNVKPVEFDTTVDKTSVTVKKVWEDHNSPSRPASASITLQYKKNEETSYKDYETVTLSQANNWTHTWPNMPKTGYTYRVVENNVPDGYQVSYTNQDQDGGGILVSSSDDGSFSGTVTNTADPYTWIEVEKVWNDGENAAGTRPDQVQFQLYYKTAGTGSWQVYPGGLLELTETDGWKGKYDKLPVLANKDPEIKYQYSVREVSGNQDLKPGDKLPGKNDAQYTVSYPEGCYTGGQWNAYEAKENERTAKLTVTNSMGVTIQVKKEWKGVQENPQTVIYAGLYKDKKPVESSYVTLDYNNGFKGEFQYLSPGNYTVKELRPAIEDETPQFEIEEGKGYVGVDNGDKITISNIAYDVGYSTGETSSDLQEITITNTAHWQIIKQSSSDSNPPLKEAVFTLTGPGDEDSVTYTGESGEDGVVRWKDEKLQPFTGLFPDGTYTLKETSAPQGYKLNEEIWTIEISNGVPVKINNGTITGNYVDGILTFYYKNTPMYALPSSGGRGIFGFIAGGILCMTGGAWIFWNRRRCRGC